MILVINSGVDSSEVLAVANGEVLSTSKRPMESSTIVGLLDMIFFWHETHKNHSLGFNPKPSWTRSLQPPFLTTKPLFVDEMLLLDDKHPLNYKTIRCPKAVKVQRIYLPPSGGFRVLVDRLWPRGVGKDSAELDDWAKWLTPSTELRKAYHDGMVWDEFRTAYMLELSSVDNDGWEVLKHDDVVLLTAAKKEPNHAHVLLEFWKNRT